MLLSELDNIVQSEGPARVEVYGETLLVTRVDPTRNFLEVCRAAGTANMPVGLTRESYRKIRSRPRFTMRMSRETFWVDSHENDLRVIENCPEIKHKFIKIGKDQEYHYGDGGYTMFMMPLYCCHLLRVPQSLKQALTQHLKALSLQRNDRHQDAPVIDIIDPDLAPNYYAPRLNPRSERSKYAWSPPMCWSNLTELVTS